MTFEQLLNHMKQLGINMSLQQGKLKVFDPNKNLNPELMAALKQHKPQLMTFIEQGRGYSGVDFPYANLDNDKLTAIARQYPQLQNIYITTPMQRGMLFHGMVDGSGASYTTQLSGDLKGDLQLEPFKRAWQKVVERHDVYRTCFVGFDLPMVHQLVQRQAVLPFIVHDWQQLDSQSQQAQLQALRIKDKQQGFDFAKPPLMRITLVKLGANHHHMIWSQHHALTDGWCGPLVFGEVNQLYLAYCQNRTPLLPDVQPFERYIAWLKKQDENRARNFFKDSLAAFNQPTPLSLDAIENDNDGKSGLVKLELQLDQQETAKLNEFARNNNCTVNVLLQAAWSYLLHRYSGENSVLFGSTISGRPADLPGMENMVGLFINTLPVAVHLDGDTQLKTLLETLQKDNASREQFGYLSLTDIHKQSGINQGQPLFDSLLVFENFPTDSALNHAEKDNTTSNHNTPYELTMEQTLVDEHTNYAITLGAFMQETLLIKIGYRLEQFATLAIQNLYHHLAAILRHFAQLADTPQGSDIRLSALDYLTEQESNNIAIGAVAYQHLPPTDTLAEQFQAQVKAQPNAIAVVCGQDSLTFSQLNQKANRIANALIQHQIQPNDCVGLYLNRSLDTLTAIIAVWKVGAAYVPMETDWPSSRLAYLVNDAQIKLVLCQQAYDQKAPQHDAFSNCQVCFVDEPSSQLSCEQPPQISGIDASTLAYVIYTSGSTGEPKGVMINQANACHFIEVFRTQLAQLAVPPDSPWLMSASYAFDASVKGPLALLMGKKVVVANQQQALDASLLAQLLIEHQIAVFNGVPSLAALVLNHYHADSKLALILGGEALSEQYNQQILAHCQATNSKAINAYGPTELTINASYAMIEPEQPINIGQAVPGAFAYVLSKDLAILPIGAIGELYVAGHGVAAGYLNRPDLTAERFIDNPFAEGKLYGTGDKVRWRQSASGERYLDFLGRIDQQVKVRGYRIELGEVETALLHCEGVSAAKVLVKTDKNRVKTLQAYICGSGGEQLEQLCFEQLHAQLPAPMVPQNIFALTKMPLTPGGKIDNRALLDYRKPEQGAVQKLAPRTPMEQQLLALWQQVLNRQDIGVDDNFFDIGGSSILSMQLMALSMQQGIMVNPGLLFQYRTIAELAAQLAPEQQIETQSEDQSILALNQSDSQLKLFCLPPFGGMASSYGLLAGALATQAQVFALQAPQLFADIATHSIEQQASDFIEKIKLEQPEGPYHLLGWSTGGVLAYEVARQLQQSHGEKQQGRLLMLDSLPSETSIKAQQQALSGAPTWYSSIRALYGKALTIDWDEMAKLPPQQGFEQVLQQFIKQQLAPEGMSEIMVKRYLQYVSDFSQRLFAHDTHPSELHLELFQVAQQTNEARTIEFSHYYNWDLLTPNVVITPVLGEHTSLLQSPNVEPLAQQIADKLSRGQA